MKEHTFDKRRNIALPGDANKTLAFAVHHWIRVAQEAIETHGSFVVALSGGSTPKKIFQKLIAPENREKLDWSKVFIFWSDERSVPPDHPDSNYRMAMEELSELPIPKEHIFRMLAENDLEANAAAYEAQIKKVLDGRPFDLIMLGMGDDGHTASLFPNTKALEVTGKWVVPNEVPQKKTWRMTFTYDLINSASHITLYVMGPGKAETLAKVFTSTSFFPSQKIGTESHKALWIIDEPASQQILPALN